MLEITAGAPPGCLPLPCCPWFTAECRHRKMHGGHLPPPPPPPPPLGAERVRWQREQALAGASLSELEALLQRAGALLEGAGIR